MLMNMYIFCTKTKTRFTFIVKYSLYILQVIVYFIYIQLFSLSYTVSVIKLYTFCINQGKYNHLLLKWVDCLIAYFAHYILQVTMHDTARLKGLMGKSSKDAANNVQTTCTTIYYQSTFYPANIIAAHFSGIHSSLRSCYLVFAYWHLTFFPTKFFVMGVYKFYHFQICQSCRLSA